METSFWISRWQENNIAFHMPSVNPLLVKYVEHLQLNRGDTVLVPLCGKTEDIGWLLDQGMCVVGIELSEQAVQQLFESLQLSPDITHLKHVKIYQGPNLKVFVGDIFEVTHEDIGNVDGVYDRAALVALPEGMRERYSEHLMAITDSANQLVVTYQYDQSLMAGPPFSIPSAVLLSYYQQAFSCHQLTKEAVPDNLKGHPALQEVWLLQRS